MSISFIDINKISSIVSIGLGLFSAIFALYCHNYTKRKNNLQLTIGWDKINIATKELAQQIKHNFKPDIIYMPSTKSGIIIHFIKEYFDEYIPVIAGQMISKKQFSKENINKIKNHSEYIYIETNKWYTFIPKTLFDYKDESILIIDDFAMSGDHMQMLISSLQIHGFKSENIKTACLATTEVAIKSGKAPSYYWKEFATTDIQMPWGKPM